MSGEDDAAITSWKALRGRHAGELRTVEPQPLPQPLLAPSRVFNLAERQHIVGLEGDSALETPEGEKPEEHIAIIAHELFHYLFFRMNPKRQAAMLASVSDSDDPLAAVAFGILDEAVATALGNGVVGQHYQPPDAFAKQLARGFTRYRAAGSVAREIFPSMSSFLDRGTTVSSGEFLRAFNRATKATFADGRPRPIDYLHSPVLIADGRFASAAQRLRDASYAGFPYLREFASLDGEPKTFLKEHPFISVAVLVPDAGGGRPRIVRACGWA